jgi:hypothetical protein
MSHPEFLKQPFEKARVQGAQRPCRDAGYVAIKQIGPAKSSFCASPAVTRKSGEVGLCPTPQSKGWLPFAIPLGKPLAAGRTSVRKIRGDSWQ